MSKYKTNAELHEELEGYAKLADRVRIYALMTNNLFELLATEGGPEHEPDMRAAMLAHTELMRELKTAPTAITAEHLEVAEGALILAAEAEGLENEHQSLLAIASGSAI